MKVNFITIILIAFGFSMLYALTQINSNDGKTLTDATITVYNLSEERTFVIGDGMNDIPMFLDCKNSIAMGNANHELKEHADFITKSINEDGVSYALKKFVYPVI